MSKDSVTYPRFHRKEGVDEISGGLFHCRGPLRSLQTASKKMLPPQGEGKSHASPDYFYKTLVIYFSFYELKNVQFIAFHRDNSYQLSDKTTQILAAAFAPCFPSHSPSNYAVITMWVITSLVTWCEEAQ